VSEVANSVVCQVLNHKAGADRKEKCTVIEVDQNGQSFPSISTIVSMDKSSLATDRRKDIGEAHEIEAWLGFDFPGRNGKYSKQKYGWEHFSGTDYDAGNDKTGIFRIVGDNKYWSQSVDDESGNADFLMFADVDFAHPEVQKDVITWGEWIVNQCKLSGFRFDAVQHFSENFTNDFVRNLEEKFGKDKLFCVGEFWVGNVDSLCGYLKDMHHKFSLFDAPLLYNFSRISTTENGDLRSVFDKTLVKAEPYNAVTLVMNHDTQPGQTVETPIEGFFKPLAYSLILLRQEGYPQLFYGDLYGMKGKNPEPVACGGKLPDLTLVRKLYAYGDQEDYFDEPNCIGFVRRGTWDHPAGLACVMSNAGPGQKRVRRIALDL
jgi:alpha-amylase